MHTHICVCMNVYMLTFNTNGSMPYTLFFHLTKYNDFYISAYKEFLVLVYGSMAFCCIDIP